MEPSGTAWVPCDVQLANWTMEEPAAAIWAPGFPVEYASSEISSSCCLQTFAPCSTEGQIVEYSCKAATQINEPVHQKEAAQEEFKVDFHEKEMSIEDRIHVAFKDGASEFKDNIGMKGRKMHRFPPGIFLSTNENYIRPTMVSIGPYYHGEVEFKPAEKMKHVAAYHCVTQLGNSVQEMYDPVVSVADDARRLYDADEKRGMGNEDFLPMLFYDACFLVQFMLSYAGRDVMDASLCSFFDANETDIAHDLLLLENQLPWSVVLAVMRFRHVHLESFIDTMITYLQLQAEEDDDEEEETNLTIVLDDGYEPPHLLGLFRHYLVGASSTQRSLRRTKSISFSVNAIELAEMGVTLTANNKATQLIQMGLKNKGTLLPLPELSLPPLSLNRSRASWLINMAALELCTTSDFFVAEDEESAVCSYLLLLNMLVGSEQDVQELRTKHVLQGGGGLTNKEALDFFTNLQDLRRGKAYVRTMQEIESYKVTCWMVITPYKFIHNNMKIIAAIFSAIGVLVGILETLKSLKSKSP